MDGVPSVPAHVAYISYIVVAAHPTPSETDVRSSVTMSIMSVADISGSADDGP